MKPVTASSTIAAYKYSPETKTLTVRFHSGHTYHYDGVTPEVAAGLEKAESVGSYLAKHIKGKFSHRKDHK